jgi:hypothetical protein
LPDATGAGATTPLAAGLGAVAAGAVVGTGVAGEA